MNKMKFVLGLVVSVVSISSNANENDQILSYAKSFDHKSCISTVADLESFFTKGNSNYGTWTFVAKEGSDDQPVNASMELTFGDSSQLIDLTVIPASDGTCSYTYTRTWYTDKNCMAATKEEFMASASYKAELNKNITAFEDDASKILVMAAGSGCILQKKEIGYRHKEQNK